jgi:hypothetical protein
VTTYGIYDNDQKILRDIREAALGPPASTSINRGVHQPARAVGRPLKKVLLGFAQLVSIEDGSGPTALWNWKLTSNDPATNTLTTQNIGSDNLGLCMVVQGATGSGGANGLLYYNVQTDGTLALLFVPLQPGMINGKITSNAAGSGKYNGKSFTPPAGDINPASDLSEADFGVLSGSEDLLVLNPIELGVSNTGHDVTATDNTDHFSLYFTGNLMSVNSDGIKVVVVNYFWIGCTDPGAGGGG